MRTHAALASPHEDVLTRTHAVQDEFQGATVAQLFLAYANLRVEHVQILLREVREAERTRRVGGLRFQLEQVRAPPVVPSVRLHPTHVHGRGLGHGAVRGRGRGGPEGRSPQR